MSVPFIPPAGYTRIQVVGSFAELVSARMGPEVNAVCWARRLEGDFDELAACFKDEEDVTSLGAAVLQALMPGLSDAGRQAAETLLEDHRLLQEHGLLPSIECVPRYLRDENAIVATDVYSFHADRSTVKADTYLCSYNEAATEGLRNEDAQPRMVIPETRAALLADFAREGGGDFNTYLRENCFDLHYAALPGAIPFSFGIGHLWRLAIAYPGCPVPPCLHRAPETAPERPPRLLLIS